MYISVSCRTYSMYSNSLNWCANSTYFDERSQLHHHHHVQVETSSVSPLTFVESSRDNPSVNAESVDFSSIYDLCIAFIVSTHTRIETSSSLPNTCRNIRQDQWQDGYFEIHVHSDSLINVPRQIRSISNWLLASTHNRHGIWWLPSIWLPTLTWTNMFDRSPFRYLHRQKTLILSSPHSHRLVHQASGYYQGHTLHACTDTTN